MELNELRAQMDETDGKLLEMFVRRMELSSQIAQYKKTKNLPVQDLKREREKLVSVAQAVPEELRDYASGLYAMLFEISRSYQNRLLGTYSALSERVNQALENTPKIFPDYEAVACQGIEGANSHSACLKLFPHANTMFFSSFEAVFTAIEKGLCRYGIVPVENSTVGSVTQVCDLMMRHRFSIVRSVRLRVSHDLLAKPGTKLEDIREIYSHQQAISQCSRFLSELKNVRVIPCENTAVAARLAATSEEKGVATAADYSMLFTASLPYVIVEDGGTLDLGAVNVGDVGPILRAAIVSIAGAGATDGDGKRLGAIRRYSRTGSLKPPSDRRTRSGTR